MKYLGIDYGEAKVGLAVGDDESHLSLPYKILKNSGRAKLLDDLAEIIKTEAVEMIVVGLPINTIGESSAQTENVKRFAADLRGRLPAAVVLHDERFSSQEAKKLGAGSAAFRRDRRDDDVAAMIMLQSYLDANL
ncbi:MAG: Holliday junction resolvase RuvX [Patescibacteria group bacterium]